MIILTNIFTSTARTQPFQVTVNFDGSEVTTAANTAMELDTDEQAGIPGIYKDAYKLHTHHSKLTLFPNVIYRWHCWIPSGIRSRRVLIFIQSKSIITLTDVRYNYAFDAITT